MRKMADIHSSKNPKNHQCHDNTKKTNVRYVEARRTGSCAFANRIASISKEHYTTNVSESIRTNILPQTCIATIVAAFHISRNEVEMKVLAMGVGTKFLSEHVLHSEEEEEEEANDEDNENQGTDSATLDNNNNSSKHVTICKNKNYYGTRIRDCHAEVLCRRAFRKYIFDCMEYDLLLRSDQTDNEISNTTTTSTQNSFISVLEPSMNHPSSILNNKDEHTNKKYHYYQLRSDVTLHMYCSSTPCGNSTIKKFATFYKEQYNTDVSIHEWPHQYELHNHVPNSVTSTASTIDTSQEQNQKQQHQSTSSPVTPVIVGHSIPLGQFALLVKKDATTTQTTTTVEQQCIQQQRILSKKETSWPMYTTTDWCPPGTTTVWSNRGSIHTCSDKIGRWNYLGIQGSLLSSYLQSPMYLSTITIGRKFSSISCRRALCCRFVTYCNNKKKPKYNDLQNSNTNNSVNWKRPKCEVIKCADEDNNSRPMIDTKIYQLHHPSVMGTNVYLDDTGMIDMTEANVKKSNTLATNQDSNSSSCEQSAIPNNNQTSTDKEIGGSGEVRFHSSMSFVTWLKVPQHFSSQCSAPIKKTSTSETTCGSGAIYEMECIDGSTGYLFDEGNDIDHQIISITDNVDTTPARNEVTQCTKLSKICSINLLQQYIRLESKMNQSKCCNDVDTRSQRLLLPKTLTEYRQFKWDVAGSYETVKHHILSNHPVFRDWKRRHRNVETTCLKHKIYD